MKAVALQNNAVLPATVLAVDPVDGSAFRPNPCSGDEARVYVVRTPDGGCFRFSSRHPIVNRKSRLTDEDLRFITISLIQLTAFKQRVGTEVFLASCRNQLAFLRNNGFVFVRTRAFDSVSSGKFTEDEKNVCYLESLEFALKHL